MTMKAVHTSIGDHGRADADGAGGETGRGGDIGGAAGIPGLSRGPADPTRQGESALDHGYRPRRRRCARSPARPRAAAPAPSRAPRATPAAARPRAPDSRPRPRPSPASRRGQHHDPSGRAISARLISASSLSPVVRPASAGTPVTPRKKRSACTREIASIAAPTATIECRNSRPLISSSSRAGYGRPVRHQQRAGVTTVARRSSGRWRASCTAVVPPSTNTTWPGAPCAPRGRSPPSPPARCAGGPARSASAGASGSAPPCISAAAGPRPRARAGRAGSWPLRQAQRLAERLDDPPPPRAVGPRGCVACAAG